VTLREELSGVGRLLRACDDLTVDGVPQELGEGEGEGALLDRCVSDVSFLLVGEVPSLPLALLCSIDRQSASGCRPLLSSECGSGLLGNRDRLRDRHCSPVCPGCLEGVVFEGVADDRE
jgi:hypothetical protein